MLVDKGHVEMDRPLQAWANDLLGTGRVELAALAADVAVESAQLPDFHGDPADRFLVATALTLHVPLVAMDEKIRAWAKAHSALTSTW